jgi:hypothetical protein
MAVSAINVSYEIQPGGVCAVRYTVAGGRESLIIPDSADGVRTDGLWQNTCFEIFLRHADDDSYFEFNFAPSGNWAAYQFSRYREGMVDLDTDGPSIQTERSGNAFVCDVSFLMPMPFSQSVAIGLSAVIEEKGGVKSYWALQHPLGQPDFHHRDCFALKLAAPERL